MVERYEAESCGGESWNLMFPQHAVAGSGVQENHRHAGAAGIAIKYVAGGQIYRRVGDLHAWCRSGTYAAFFFGAADFFAQ